MWKGKDKRSQNRSLSKFGTGTVKNSYRWAWAQHCLPTGTWFQGDELKKEVEEKTVLLAEAARAIDNLQAKQAAKMSLLEQQLDRERAERLQAELRLR